MKWISSTSKCEPNKDILKITKLIISQNNDILQMNKRLIDMLTSPAIVVNTSNLDITNLKEKVK